MEENVFQSFIEVLIDCTMERNEGIIVIRDLMSSNIISVSFQTSVLEAARVMKTRDISSVLVKSGDEFVGILTDRDIINKVVALGLDPGKIIVKEFMSKPLITINEDVGIDEAAEKMRDNKIRRLIVVGKKGIVGVISESDLIRVEPELHFLIREHSRLELRSSYPIGVRERSFVGFCEECGNYSEYLEKVNGIWVCDDCRS